MMATESKHITILPRLIRWRDAPGYLGMDRNRFNREVRPFVCEIPIGKQGIAFDRLDLDAWVEDYKSRNGRPMRTLGDSSWDEEEVRGLGIETGSGISISGSSVSQFDKALEQATSKKRS